VLLLLDEFIERPRDFASALHLPEHPFCFITDHRNVIHRRLMESNELLIVNDDFVANR
jgi:hypothetical protein